MFGSLTITDSTLSGNSAQGGSGGTGAKGGSGYGGALFNLDGKATLTYVTVANNNAIAGAGGSSPGDANGGVYNLAYGNTILGSGIIPTPGANTSTLTLNNSVIGQNSGGHNLVSDAENGKKTNSVQINGSSSLVQGGVVQIGNGIHQVTGLAITVTSAPRLATTLANNGGVTPTLAPLSGSPVLGAGIGHFFLGTLPSVDQRDLPRPASNPDDGAYQTQRSTTTVPNVRRAFNSTGETVEVKATVDTFGEPVTEGKVTFTIAGLPSVTATISPSDPGVATATVHLPNTLNAGNYQIDTAYTDVGGIENPSNGVGALTIQVATSVVTVTNSANLAVTDSFVGQTVTVSATVSSSNGGVVNQGSVTFSLPGVTPVTVAVNAAGQATATLTLPSGLAPGSYTLTASYADKIDGHVDFAASRATSPLADNPPSPSQSALTIALDTAALLLQSDMAALVQLAMIDQVFLDQSLPTNASDLLAQILDELPYAEFLAGLAIQAGMTFAPS
jgi:hypothetical protein